MLGSYQPHVMLHPGGHSLVEIHAIHEMKGHSLMVPELMLFMKYFFILNKKIYIYIF